MSHASYKNGKYRQKNLIKFCGKNGVAAVKSKSNAQKNNQVKILFY